MEKTIHQGEIAGDKGLQEPVPGRSLFSFMMLPEGPMDAIARLSGVLGFFTALEIYKRFGWIRSDYKAQSWWWGDTCLDLPHNETLVTLLLVLAAIASIAMAFGYRGKIAPLIVALSFAYVTALDIFLGFPHSYFLSIWVCIALLFSRSPESVSRRLIQLALVACYGFSGLQKFLTPEFISGHALASYSTGYSIQKWFASIMQGASLDPQSWQIIAIFVSTYELSMALCLCFKKTRTAGVCGIILFQLAIFATMASFIALLHSVIFVCCLAFFDRLPSLRFWKEAKNQAETTVQAGSPGKLYFVGAVLAAVCLLSIPIRIYLIPGALANFSLLDRRPWTFCMFVQMEKKFKTTISVRKANAAWEPIEPTGRMKNLSGDVEMRALAHHLVKSSPPFDELRIESEYLVNLGFIDRKILTGKAVAPGKFEYNIAWSRSPVSK